MLVDVFGKEKGRNGEVPLARTDFLELILVSTLSEPLALFYLKVYKKVRVALN